MTAHGSLGVDAKWAVDARQFEHRIAWIEHLCFCVIPTLIRRGASEYSIFLAKDACGGKTQCIAYPLDKIGLDLGKICRIENGIAELFSRFRDGTTEEPIDVMDSDVMNF